MPQQRSRVCQVAVRRGKRNRRPSVNNLFCQCCSLHRAPRVKGKKEVCVCVDVWMVAQQMSEPKS